MTESKLHLLTDHSREEIDGWLARYPEDQKQSASLAALRVVQHQNDGHGHRRQRRGDPEKAQKRIHFSLQGIDRPAQAVLPATAPQGYLQRGQAAFDLGDLLGLLLAAGITFAA